MVWTAAFLKWNGVEEVGDGLRGARLGEACVDHHGSGLNGDEAEGGCGNGLIDAVGGRGLSWSRLGPKGKGVATGEGMAKSSGIVTIANTPRGWAMEGWLVVDAGCPSPTYSTVLAIVPTIGMVIENDTLAPVVVIVS